ncbi:hypothetical protein [Haliscomenobacter sp.]|uniref:hypothetical protein n=1 Tax=Haliscomenobacter sp. TaxID=2717303 RepID=UPI003594088C
MLEKGEEKAELEKSKDSLLLPQDKLEGQAGPEESTDLPLSQEKVRPSPKGKRKNKNNEIEHTRIELPNWRELTTESANFIYLESEKRLKEIIDACNYTQETAHKMFTVLLPIISIAIGYLFSKKWNDDWKIMLPAMVFISVQLIAIFFLMLSILHKTLHSLGSNPIDMLKPEFIVKDSQYILYLIGICEAIQSKINHNHSVNTKTALRNNIAIILATFISPLSFFITSLIIWWWE